MSRISHFTCVDPVIEQGQWRALFNDQIFNGNRYSISLLYDSGSLMWRADSLDLKVQVLEGTQDFYNYNVSYFKHRYAQYSDFFNPTEPVIMYSNIENGYGIFAGYRSKFYPINMKN